MEKEQQETLLQTIKARLEWNERGDVTFFPDESGAWTVTKNPEPKAPLTRYFNPQYVKGFDKFGNPDTHQPPPSEL